MPRGRQRGASQRSRRRSGAALTAASAVAALGLCACSSGPSSSSGSSSGSPSTAAGSGPGAASVTGFEARPAFVAPGPAFDARKAAGKTVWVVPTTSQVSVVPEVEAAMTAALGTAGVKIKLVTTAGLESQWVQGIETAVAQKAAAIVLLGISPTLVAPQLADAAKAGIPVVYTFSYQGLPVPQNVGGVVSINYPTIAKVIADKAILDTHGDAHVLIIKSPDLPPQGYMTQTITGELARECPKCTVEKVLNEPIADWATQINSDTRTALLGDPKINAVIPLSDSMNEWVVPALRAANPSGQVKIYTVDGTPAIVSEIKDGTITGDNGYSNQWVGWASADQALRLMTGTAPVADENVPFVLYDSANIARAPGDLSTYYGDPEVTGYKKLWGV